MADSMPTYEDLPLSAIRLDGGTQPRAEISLFAVDEYAEAIRNGAVFPPVVVFRDAVGCWLGDGFHRYMAHQQAAQPTVRAEVRIGDRRAAVLYSLGANATHGLPRTNDDKRRAVRMLLQDDEWMRWADREVARVCAVSHEFVRKLRGELSVNGSQIAARKVERNGTVYTMAPKVNYSARIPEDVRAVVRETLVVNNPTQLKQLAKLDAPQQQAVAATIAAGDAPNVRKAIGVLQAAVLNAAPTPLPTGPFQVLVADPPWRYDNRQGDPTQRGQVAYATLTTEEICNLEIDGVTVADLADENAVLWLWTTNAHLRDAFDVLAAWGFSHKTMLTWVKDRIGLGTWLRGQTEHCLLAVRGQPVVTLRDESTVLHAPTREHSRKPDEFYALVERLCAGARVELFARESRPGWQAWGAERELFNAVPGAEVGSRA